MRRLLTTLVACGLAAGIAVGLAYAMFMNTSLLVPNPIMPDAVRAAHFVETASSNFIFGLIVGGLTNKEMGRALGLSPRTVETHRANLFDKLEVVSLAQLIRAYAALVDGDLTA